MYGLIIVTVGYIPNTSDDEGRYSFKNQPEVGYFNLEKLMIAMSSLLFQKRYHTVIIIVFMHAM